MYSIDLSNDLLNYIDHITDGVKTYDEFLRERVGFKPLKKSFACWLEIRPVGVASSWELPATCESVTTGHLKLWSQEESFKNWTWQIRNMLFAPNPLQNLFSGVIRLLDDSGERIRDMPFDNRHIASIERGSMQLGGLLGLEFDKFVREYAWGPKGNQQNSSCNRS
jgi:hypothetical protein